MKTYDVFIFQERYGLDLYSEDNRVKNLEVTSTEHEGIALLHGRPINRYKGARHWQIMSMEELGHFEMVLRNQTHPNGPLLHIQADIRRADGGKLIERMKRCINWEKTLAANGHTEHIKFLIRERAV